MQAWRSSSRNCISLSAMAAKIEFGSVIVGEKGRRRGQNHAGHLVALRVLVDLGVLLVNMDQQRSASYWATTQDDDGIRTRIARIKSIGKSKPGF